MLSLDFQSWFVSSSLAKVWHEISIILIREKWKAIENIDEYMIFWNGHDKNSQWNNLSTERLNRTEQFSLLILLILFNDTLSWKMKKFFFNEQ